jgi:catechol 2,3-dioxygenase-like lactoylglutathione lyase family enzyme
MFQRLHHAAYWCQDAQRTKDFYVNLLGLKFVVGLLTAEDHQAHGNSAEHIHIFFECAEGSYIAFFDLPGAQPTGADTGIPKWVNHIAFEVESMEALMEGKRRLEAAGYPTRGPQDHGLCQSLYFADPDGNQLEMAVRTDGNGLREKLAREAESNLAAWNTRKARRVAAASA